MTPAIMHSVSPTLLYTLEYYMNIADQLIAAGAEEICLKDMAGIGKPAFLGKLTKIQIRTSIHDHHQYHGRHSGPGLYGFYPRGMQQRCRHHRYSHRATVMG